MAARSTVAWLMLVAACSATTKSKLGPGEGGESSGAGAGSSGTGLGVTGSGSTGTGEMQCGKSTVGNQVPGAMLILLDRSGSMGDTPDGGNGTTKWDSTIVAVTQMVKVAKLTLEVGLLPFPKGDFSPDAAAGCFLNPAAPGCAAVLADGGCADVGTVPAVPIQPLAQNGAAIISWLGQNGPYGGTPTLHALMNAFTITKAHKTAGQRFVVLITDGVPNTAQPPFGPLPAMQVECKQLPDIEKVVVDGASGTPSVHTYVIGSPGSEAAAKHLSQLAVNGKTQKDAACSVAAGNCHYQIGTANFEKDLAAVLAAIAGSVSDCIFDVPQGQNIDPNLVNVTVTDGMGKASEIFKDPAHQDGWDYADAAQDKIQLFGPACAAFKAGKGSAITIILGCQSKIK